FEMPERRIERRADSLTIYVSFAGPLQARLGSRDVKVDFTLTERLVFPVVNKPVISSYSDRIDREIGSYALEEVLTEKLCAVIGRTEPRDVYDLHFLMGRSEIDFLQIPGAFAEKAKSKNVDPARLGEALGRSGLEKMWETRLVHQIKELPHLEQVLRGLKRKLKEHGLLELQA
ncbi:MAG: nucleotidyl transferase AbiEii/AbiGii toxin family protein, partial [Coriobacteriia bacterium]|nr:nucleotidyl transferase AbiEii/AbiGii toxin family protein [Coriobacteriia bacterium]